MEVQIATEVVFKFWLITVLVLSAWNVRKILKKDKPTRSK